jgi:hypothetical protein
MAVHELCLAVTYYGVTAANIARVEVDRAFSCVEERGGRVDFRRLGFTLTTDAGASLAIRADRCGGNSSAAVVTAPGGAELFRAATPDAALEAEVAAGLEVRAPPRTRHNVTTMGAPLRRVC